MSSLALALPPLETAKGFRNFNAPHYEHSTLSAPTSAEPQKLPG